MMPGGCWVSPMGIQMSAIWGRATATPMVATTCTTRSERSSRRKMIAHKARPMAGPMATQTTAAGNKDQWWMLTR